MQTGPYVELSEQSDLIGYEQAATLLALKKKTLYGLVHERRIPHVRFGPRLVRFSRCALRDWINANSVRQDGVR